MACYRIRHIDAEGVARRMRVTAEGRAAALEQVELRFGLARFLSVFIEGRRV